VSSAANRGSVPVRRSPKAGCSLRSPLAAADICSPNNLVLLRPPVYFKTNIYGGALLTGMMPLRLPIDGYDGGSPQAIAEGDAQHNCFCDACRAFPIAGPRFKCLECSRLRPLRVMLR
jgi:hypothetical protein